MTKLIFFDTDCLSSFLLVNRRSLLTNLYKGRIIVPIATYNEIFSKPPFFVLINEFKKFVVEAEVEIRDIDNDTEEAKLYFELTQNTSFAIGKGEAAAIVLAKQFNGILASNNKADVSRFVRAFGLEHISTDLILIEALQKGLIDEKTGNSIWRDMLVRNFKLPPGSFSDFLTSHKQ